jgi:miniconductance mechanosensitive channel
LQSTSHGVPLEVYAFSHDKRFENYEYIMSDIFDHIIASVGYFDLEIFETVSENDFKV